jgi:hypothetical protein
LRGFFPDFLQQTKFFPEKASAPSKGARSIRTLPQKRVQSIITPWQYVGERFLPNLTFEWLFQWQKACTPLSIDLSSSKLAFEVS